ncbi:GNAT family N-acetyltransferase [Alicyclobacillus ferrooxydans]|uniref:GCN5 family acetyltransferase n=1 Tax=Alicyclobacillus ferrooxydans TaxID=471514 RepID=A0A0P9CAD4_9BACL|nr:GNAT family N-acetyltransferase [Alicyclobacillus ferrooxydans]KPV42323.1 GCN5 family acetyltransferase [Alicyclobacillus ferrooxydans]
MDLVTNRLILREFQVEDIEAVHAYASDPEVCRYSDWGPNTNEDTRKFMEDTLVERLRHPRNQFALGIVIKDSNELIGACSLTRTEPLQGEIGYSLNRNYWGYGFATEAAQAMLRFAFKELNLHRVYATCRPSNIGSSRVLEKVGMTREGHLREHRFFKGQWHDSFLYAILHSELKTDDN